MAFYKENNLNPLGGCLPLLLQTPIFIILYNVIRGLTRIAARTAPSTRSTSTTRSELYQSLDGADEMMAFGVDLAESASKALQEGFVDGPPPRGHGGRSWRVTSYYQQKQIQGRNPNAEMPPQQKMLMRLLPAMFVVFAFVSPVGAGRVLRDVEPLPDRHAGLHHPNPLPRRGLARRPGPAGRRRGQEAARRRRAAPDAAPPRRARKAPAPPKRRRRRRPTPAPTSRRQPTAAAANGADGSRGRTPPPTSRTDAGAQNRSKKKKKRR